MLPVAFSAPACKPRQYWTQKGGKTHQYCCTKSIRAYSPKPFCTLSVCSNPNRAEKPHRWGIRSSQINQTMGQSRTWSADRLTSQSGTGGTRQPSRCEVCATGPVSDPVWHSFVVASGLTHALRTLPTDTRLSHTQAPVSPIFGRFQIASSRLKQGGRVKK